MAYIISLLCLLIAFIGVMRNKYFFNPITFMFAIWGVIVPISVQGFYGMKSPSDKSLLIISLGLIGYLLGCLVGNRRKRIIIKQITRTNVDYAPIHLNYSILYILISIALVYFAWAGFVSLRLLLSGKSFMYIKQLAVDFEGTNELRSSVFTITVKNFIAQPTAYLAIALLPIEIFFGRRDKKLIIASVCLAFLWVLSTAGRAIIIWIALYFAAVYLYYRIKLKIEKRKIKLRTKILLAIGVVLLFIALIYTTTLRKGSNYDIYRQMLIYFVAPIPHMDYYVQAVDSGYSEVLGLGLSSFYGFAYPFLFLIRLLIGRFPEFSTLIRFLSFDMFERSISLGGTIYMNAYVTIFFQPYVDGRLLGVFLLLMLFGYWCGRLFYNSFYLNDMRSFLFYILFLQKIMDSTVRFYFTQTSQAMCFIFAFLVTANLPFVIERKEIFN